jgi:hypothetical protein
MYQWRLYLSGETPSDDLPEYSQCEKVFVGKVPYVCNAGELIYIDADVADKYCTEQVFTRTKDSVYCIYNGERPDRKNKLKKFKKSTKLSQ